MSLLKKGIHWQKRLAAWIGGKSNSLSLTTKKIMLLCMILIGGAYCFYRIISVFNNKEGQKSYSVTGISIPQHIEQAGESNYPFISKKEFEGIHRFHLYMDSLAKDPSGRKLYDHIMRNRPGLPDSIKTIENIYQSQIKK